MTLQQARQLQRAVSDQAQARSRLISAAHPDAIVDAAAAYIAATDRAYDIAVEIKETTR